jgi:polysaccharide pyruvyl transferase WcaK-like protein
VPTQTPRIAFWGNFGTGNWGNECTLQALVHNTRRVAPGAVLSCFCYRPSDTLERHGLPSFPITDLRARAGRARSRRPPTPLRVVRRLADEARSWRETFGLAQTCDVIVMAGTGMLTDNGEGAMGMPYEMFKWSIIAKVRGRKVLFTSVGVEPIDHPLSKFFIATALRLADYRSYRDGQSRDRLRRIGFHIGKDPVYPDLAFSLPDTMAAPKRSSTERLRIEGNTIAVGLFDHRGRGLGGPSDALSYKAYLEKIASFVMWLLEHDHRVRIIIGDLTYDEPVLEDLRVLLTSRGVAKYAGQFNDEPARSVEDVIDHLAAVDFVVASRFHNVLLALMLGKPVVSISYNEKNDALLTQMGLGGYCRPIETFDVDWLIDRVLDIQANGERLKPGILERAAQFRGDLEEQYRLLFGPRFMGSAPKWGSKARAPRPPTASGGDAATSDAPSGG